MLRKLKLLFLGLALMAPLAINGATLAQFGPIDSSCEGVSDSAICEEAKNTEDPITGSNGVLLRVSNLLAIVAGIIAVIIIVIAGITMTLSGGDSNKVSNSRNAIIYAAVGIIVIIIARGLVVFIINRVG